MGGGGYVRPASAAEHLVIQHGNELLIQRGILVLLDMLRPKENQAR